MKPVVEICLGSSCFSRGNALTLERVEDLLEKLGIRSDVDLKGRLCTDNCAEGPCLTIEGRAYHRIHPDAAEDLLIHHLKGRTE